MVWNMKSIKKIQKIGKNYKIKKELKYYTGWWWKTYLLQPDIGRHDLIFLVLYSEQRT